MTDAEQFEAIYKRYLTATGRADTPDERRCAGYHYAIGQQITIRRASQLASTLDGWLPQRAEAVRRLVAMLKGYVYPRVRRGYP